MRAVRRACSGCRRGRRRRQLLRPRRPLAARHPARSARIRAALGVELPHPRPVRGADRRRRSPRGSTARSAAAGRRWRPRAAAASAVPLSFAQQRLWFLDRLDGPSADLQHAGRRCRLTRRARRRRAGRRRSRDVVARHEALRTVFPAADGEPVAGRSCRPTPPARRCDVVRSTHARADGRAAGRRGRADAFDLTAELPLRGVRCSAHRRRRARRSCWCCTTSPATAGRVAPLLRRPRRPRTRRGARARRRTGRRCRCSTPTTPLWQRELLGDRDDPDSLLAPAARLLARRAAPDLPESSTLPADRPRPARRPTAGGSCRSSVDPQLHARAGATLARDAAARRLFMVLQAALAALLTRLGAGTDIPIGTPVAGRTDEALDDLVGFFVNTLVLRTDTVRRPDLPRAAGPGPRGRPGRVRPPGRAVRAPRRGAQPDPVAGPAPAVPGHARPPERARRPLTDPSCAA